MFLCVNPFLSNTIEIHKGHTVIENGMYEIVRHPMYLATVLVYTGGLIILRSLWTTPLLLLFVFLLNNRAKKEEEQLIANLPNYIPYMQKVRFRIIPFVM